MKTDNHMIFIVDDDARIREALGELLESHGMHATAFASAGDYVGADKPDVPACLILDEELPDINGLELQGQIAQGNHPPIVFITGHGDIPSSVRAIKHGAVDFLTKPFSDADLMAAIDTAIARDREERSARAELEQAYAELEQRFDGADVPCPPHWGGYLVSPEVVEFWQGRRSRMHDRLQYRREGNRRVTERLAP